MTSRVLILAATLMAAAASAALFPASAADPVLGRAANGAAPSPCRPV